MGSGNPSRGAEAPQVIPFLCAVTSRVLDSDPVPVSGGRHAHVVSVVCVPFCVYLVCGFGSTSTRSEASWLVPICGAENPWFQVAG